MGALNLTIQVQNVDPTVTTEELETYFSYCGTVDKIRLQRQGKNFNYRLAFQVFAQTLLFLMIPTVRLISYDDGTGIRTSPNQRW